MTTLLVKRYEIALLARGLREITLLGEKRKKRKSLLTMCPALLIMWDNVIRKKTPGVMWHGCVYDVYVHVCMCMHECMVCVHGVYVQGCAHGCARMCACACECKCVCAWYYVCMMCLCMVFMCMVYGMCAWHVCMCMVCVHGVHVHVFVHGVHVCVCAWYVYRSVLNIIGGVGAEPRQPAIVNMYRMGTQSYFFFILIINMIHYDPNAFI